MKRNLYIIMVCCATALVSCKKNEVDNPNPGTDPEPQPEGKAVLYGSLGETTKTYLSPRSDGEGNPEAWFDVYWEKNDEIAICKDNNNQYAVYWTQEDSGKNKVRFEKKSGTDLELNNVFDALYPASLVDNTGALLWPSEQRYQEISASPAGAAGNNPMWATAKVLEGQTIMQFYNLGGVIRFKLSRPTAEFKVVKAMISADQPMSGTFELQEITLPESETKIRKAVISDGSGDVTITPKDTVTISTDGAASFYFAVPEGTYSGIQITLVGDDGKKVNARLAAGKALEVKRAEVVRLTANGVTPSMEGSNCFIGEGNVPIVITAMGNAFNGNTALDGNDEKAVWKAIGNNAKGCKIVWQTNNTVTPPSAAAGNLVIERADFVNGVLTVIPTGTPGNALVAITDGANGTGNIVWSYHIWVPETPLNIVRINNANGKVVFIDRNIGALRAADPNVTDNTKSIGLLYQWGRKDPLMGFCDFGNNMMNGFNPTNYISQGFKNALQTPDKPINASNGFWHNVGLPYLWGYPDESITASPISKTIYDPCPIGYRIPDNSKFNCLSGLAVVLNNNTLYAASVPLFFPCSGFFSSGGTKYNGVTGYFAVATAIANSSSSTENWNLKISNNKFSIDRSGAYAYTGIVKSVRCVRDDSQSPASEGYTLNEMDHEYINFFE